MEPAGIPTLATTPDAGEATQIVEARPGASLTSDIAAFSGKLDEAAAAAEVAEPSPVAKAMFAPLDRIDLDAQELVNYATEAVESGDELTSSEVIMLTVRSHEFMFHSQLTANVANRTADGMQQLFRQQG